MTAKRSVKPAVVGKARMTGLVMAEEIAQFEAELVDALDEAKKAKSTAERYRSISNGAQDRVDRLRDSLTRRIRMFRDLVKGDGIREDVAARWLYEERLAQGIPDAKARATVPLNVEQALPYAKQLLAQAVDEAADAA